jgi:hypothetical protein
MTSHGEVWAFSSPGGQVGRAAPTPAHQRQLEPLPAENNSPRPASLAPAPG